MSVDRQLSASSRVAALIREKDWSGTSLGPRESWPESLHTTLRLMLGSRFAMWLGWGPDLALFYNDAYAEQTLGAKHPGSLGRPFREVWSEVSEVVEDRVRRVLHEGEATWDEGLLLFLERSGYPEETYHTFSYSPAPGAEAGQVVGLFCVVIEETERVLAERRMAHLQELAARLGPAKSEAGVFQALEATLTAHWKDIPFALAYGIDDDSGEYVRLARTHFPTDHEAAPERLAATDPSWPLARVLETGETLEVPLDPAGSWPRAGWNEAPSRALLVPLFRSRHEKPLGVLVAGITPYRPLDAELRNFVQLVVGQVEAALANARAYEEETRRADALAELDRAKTTFFSNVSHEFRTPLTLMLGPTEEALRTPEGALRGADLETVHRNELRLLKLVNMLLEFARIEAGRIEAAFEPTALGPFTAELASSFRSAVERAGLSFEVQVEASDEPVYVDHTMFEQIVFNLLSNALKFTFEGGLAVAFRSTAEHVELSVRDSGVGIEASELPRLFERFHRIEGTRARTHEGSGIGLALVHELVRLHGGRIDVQSEPGVGTTFTVQLPRGSAHLPAHQVRHEPRTPSALTPTTGGAYVAEALRWSDTAASRSAPPTAVHEQGRIFVVDDNADMRDYLVRLLRERWDVEAFATGKAVLEAIRREEPALVLSDVMMPGISGLDLVRTLRSDPATRAIPVVLLSARAGEEAAADGLESGADDYIVKPFSSRDLLMRIGSRLAAAQAAKAAHAVREDLYRHFMQAPFPVAVFRGERHVLDLANDATLTVWGRSRHEALGRPLLEVLPELHDQPFLGYLDRVYRTGTSHTGSAELARLARGPEGAIEDVFFTFVYAPLFDRNGAVEGVLLSAFEVTEQVLAAREVERARDRAEHLARQLALTTERLQAAQQVAGVGTFEWDLTRGTMVWSPETFALFGLQPGSVWPSPSAWAERLFEPSDVQAAFTDIQRARASAPPPAEIEVQLRQESGGARWVRLSTHLQFDAEGNAQRVLGALVDVQLLKEASVARARALREAERIDRAKDEFLATMSHELRTPLNAMLGWAKLLRAGAVGPERVAHGLDVIERNAQTQARLVADLLDVSRIISGKLRLAVQRVAVESVVQAAVEVVSQAAEAKGVKLESHIDPAVGDFVADPDRLQQIVWNLLSNAIKFTPSGGAVSVRAERRESSLHVHVRDTGAGIDAAHLPLIFERFHQVDSTTTRSQGGLGLGLAIVRHLVEAHGGVVRATSEGAGRGSTFSVTLPMRAVYVEEPAPEENRAAAGDGEATAATPKQGVLAGLRILVVDDDDDSRELLAFVLEGAGARVVSASSAERALEAYTLHPVDVVISDIGMPHMDGYELMQALHARHPQVRAIALTAYARAEDTQRALRAGFVDHLPKPVDADELLTRVRRALDEA